MLERPSLFFIDIYQNYIRVLLPSSCRFSPSCSEYAKQAILQYGFWLGTWKAARRLLRCHPFSDKAGYDPLI